MPIGIVSDDDFLREVKSYPSGSSAPPRGVTTPTGQIIVPTGTVIESPKRGRKEGSVEVPDGLRQIIGETSVLEGRSAALDLAKEWGISPSSVSAYAKGATSTASYDTPKPSIINHINKSRARATKKATHVLNAALQAITQEKLDYTDADKLSGIAKDMSAIIKNLEPPAAASQDPSSRAVQFTIFAPQFRDERTFETIQVQE